MKVTVNIDQLRVLYRMITTSRHGDTEAEGVILEVLKSVRIAIYTKLVQMADSGKKEVKLRLNRVQLLALSIHLGRLDFIGDPFYDNERVALMMLIDKELL